MLSIPHMIVVFLVVLVVFGPKKLPELARSFGKLMAEFRKASNDFKSAFEEEMRDLERQARIAELKKQVAEATAAANAAATNVPNLNHPTTPAAQGPRADSPEVLAARQAAQEPANPYPESVPRVDATNGDLATPTNGQAAEVKQPEGPSEGNGDHPAEPSPSHDQQQPA